MSELAKFKVSREITVTAARGDHGGAERIAYQLWRMPEGGCTDTEHNELARHHDRLVIQWEKNEPQDNP